MNDSAKTPGDLESLQQSWEASMQFSVRSLLVAVALFAGAFALIVLEKRIDDPMRKVPAITLAIALLGSGVGAFFSRGLLMFFIAGFIGFVAASWWAMAQYVSV